MIAMQMSSEHSIHGALQAREGVFIQKFSENPEFNMVHSRHAMDCGTATCEQMP